MNSKTKTEQIKEISSLLWDSYEHMFTARKTNNQNSVNFLLVIVTFLSAISINLYTYFKSEIFLVPEALQIIALLILLKSFFIITSIWTPWFKMEETVKNLDNEKFWTSTFAVLKTMENSTMVELTEIQKVIRKSLFLIIFSLYSTILAWLLLIFKTEILYISILILSAGFVWLYFYYRTLPTFNFDEDINRYTKQIDEWLRK